MTTTLPPSAVTVAAALANLATQADDPACFTIDSLALYRSTGLHRNVVLRALKALEAAGAVTFGPGKKGPGGGRRSVELHDHWVWAMAMDEALELAPVVCRVAAQVSEELAKPEPTVDELERVARELGVSV